MNNVCGYTIFWSDIESRICLNVIFINHLFIKHEDTFNRSKWIYRYAIITCIAGYELSGYLCSER